MTRTLKELLVVSLVIVLGGAIAAAEPARGFGFGGPTAYAFFPDMTGINTFMSENGLPPMDNILLGVGGNGRGGVIGGPVFGGSGWGIFGVSETEDRSAELVFGGGGFDIGGAIGGDDSSVLTIGMVFGGGANLLTVEIPDLPDEDFGPSGLIIEPRTRDLGRAVAFVQPYISMAAQFFPWMGFEVRLGYILPVFGYDFGDQMGIPAPSLDLSGPMVSVGLTFGGIASGRSREGEDGWDPDKPEVVTRTESGSIPVSDVEELVIENAIGEVRVESYRAEIEGTGAGPIVSWEATLTTTEMEIDEVAIESETEGLSAFLSSFGKGMADLTVRVPAGLDLKVTNGTGTVTVVGHEAPTIVVETGAGEVFVEDVQAMALIAAAGVGSIEIVGSSAESLIANVGLGEILLTLPSDASATLTARARLGTADIDRFPGMLGGLRGFLGKRGTLTLGAGEQTIELEVGVGEIDVWMEAP